MLHFEKLKTEAINIREIHIYRAKIPGGWLVVTTQHIGDFRQSTGITFVPDVYHEWDGNSIVGETGDRP